MLRHPQTAVRMTRLLERAQDILTGDSDAQFFLPGDATSILENADVGDALLNGLLFSEAQVILHAFQAGLKIGKFMADANAKPSDAVTALAEFGSKLVEAFNHDVSTLLGPGLRSLGTRVFLDGAAGLDSTIAPTLAQTNAMLNLEFLKPAVTFDGPALLAAGRVDAAQLAFADRAVQLA